MAAGFSLAAGQAVAQTAIATDAAGLLAGRVDIPVADGKMPAYRAAPQGKKNLPTLLVVSEIFGVHEYIQDICRRLAHLGYLAVAPELFARQGDPSRYTDIPKLQAEIISKVPDAQVQRDLDAASAWAVEHGGDAGRLGILGFCWGGRQVWLYAAHNPKLRAGAAWYGQLGGEPSELKPRPVLSAVGDLKAPVLGAYGGKDAGIPLADVDRMRVALGAGRRQGLAHRHLSRSAACLPCGLPAQLPQGRGRSGLAAHAGLVQAERAVGEGGGAWASRFLPLQVRPEGRREPCLCPISRFPRQAVADLGQGRLHVLVADDALVLEAAEHAAAAVHARALHLFHHGLALVQPLSKSVS